MLKKSCKKCVKKFKKSVLEIQKICVKYKC